MKYIIAHTWNGQGYSHMNKAELKEFNSDTEAQTYIKEKFQQEEGLEDYEVTEEHGRIVFDNGENQGSWQWLKADFNTYGVAIICNVNEVEVYTEEEYNAKLDEAIEQANPEDVEDIGDRDNAFIPAYEEDFDYQFIGL